MPSDESLLFSTISRFVLKFFNSLIRRLNISVCTYNLYLLKSLHFYNFVRKKS